MRTRPNLNTSIFIKATIAFGVLSKYKQKGWYLGLSGYPIVSNSALNRFSVAAARLIPRRESGARPQPRSLRKLASFHPAGWCGANVGWH
jgi:hypothetical protein